MGSPGRHTPAPSKARLDLYPTFEGLPKKKFGSKNASVSRRELFSKVLQPEIGGFFVEPEFLIALNRKYFMRAISTSEEQQFITKEFADTLAGKTPAPYLRMHDPAQQALVALGQYHLKNGGATFHLLISLTRITKAENRLSVCNFTPLNQ